MSLFSTAIGPLWAVPPHSSPLPLDIPAQPLAHALGTLAAETGIQILFSEPTIRDRHSSPVSGRLAPDEALEQLLAGTGVTAQSDVDGVYMLVPGSEISTFPTLNVTAADQSVNLLAQEYAGGQIAQGVRLGVLGNTDIMDAPFSTTSYTAKAIENQQSDTIAEAVNRDPSVRYTVLPGGNVDNLYIRGFPIWEGNSGEIAFDGIYGVAPNYRVRTEYVERIEVVKGPGALLFGMSPNGSVGGVINIAPKRALIDASSVTSSYITNNQLKQHLDLSRRLGADDRYGIRFNGSYYNGDTAIERQSTRGNVAAVALDYEGERFRSTLDLLSQRERIDATGRPIMPSGTFPMPAAPRAGANATQSWEWSQNREQAVLLRTEYDIDDQLSVFANAGLSSAKVARIYDSAPRLIDAYGNTLTTPTYAIFDVSRTTFDGGLRSRFRTGSVDHSLTLQLSAYHETLDRALNAGTTVASNLYRPTLYPRQDIARPTEVPRINENRNDSVALVDTLTLLQEKLRVSIGLRRQRIESTNYNTLTNGGDSVYDQRVTTPAIGVVVRPLEHLSLYANYIEGLSKGDVAPPAALNYGEVMAPYKSKQREIGGKFDFGDFMTTIALFQIEKPSGGLRSDGVFSVNAQQRNRGIELYGYGQLYDRLRLLGGATLLDAQITRSGTASLLGNTPIGVAERTANLGAEWDCRALPGLTLLTDVVYTGKQYVNQNNTTQIPAWTRLDIGARYKTKIAGYQSTFRTTLQNVANTSYWAGVTSWGAVSTAIPRTLLVSATLDF